jgi:hypothetical protein
MVCVISLLGTPGRFNVGRDTSHKVGLRPIPNGTWCLMAGAYYRARVSIALTPLAGSIQLSGDEHFQVD